MTAAGAVIRGSLFLPFARLLLSFGTLLLLTFGRSFSIKSLLEQCFVLAGGAVLPFYPFLSEVISFKAERLQTALLLLIFRYELWLDIPAL